jgi:transcriptional regulator with XRE-family HTH domain
MKLYLAEIRHRKGLTQEQLAHLGGVDRSTVNRLENNFRGWSDKTLDFWAGILGVETHELLGYCVKPHIDAPPSVCRLHKLIDGLQEEDAKAVEVLIEQFLAAVDRRSPPPAP